MSFKTKIFNSVNAIPSVYFDLTKCTKNHYFSYNFLKAYELGNPNICFAYIFILKQNQPIAFAITQLVSINIKTISKNIKIPQWLRRLINGAFCRSHIKVLFCGNVFLSGEYGLYIHPKENIQDAFQYLATCLQMQIKQTKPLHGVFVKDFVKPSLPITNYLLDLKYSSLTVEPNMLIQIKPEWQNFDDYKMALKSKYRIKVNRADSKSKVLKSYFFSESDIRDYLHDLQQLYHNTIKNADFNAQVLDLKTYIDLKQNFPKQFFLKGYFYNEKLVGFLSAMKNDQHLDAHFIGVDYSKNKTLAIYPRILNDYVRLGIETKAAKINLGRTASEIKSTLGAVPQTLTCYFKHPNRIINRWTKPFIKRLPIKSFKQHQPFRNVSD